MSLRLSTTTRLMWLVSAVVLGAFVLLGSGIQLAVSAMLWADAQEVVRVQGDGLRDLERAAGLRVLLEEVTEETESPSDPDLVFAVFDATGVRIAGSALPLPSLNAGPRVVVRDLQTDDHARTLLHAVPLQQGGTLVVGLRLRAQDGFRRLMWRAAGGALLVALLMGPWIGWLVSRWVTRRLEGLDEAVRGLGEGDLARRVPHDGSGDAFDRIAQRFNAMADRIVELLSGVRSATDHIAHDLRTPLTQLRNRLVTLRTEMPEGSRTREGLDSAVEETDRLLDTFSALLRLSRIEGQAQAGSAPFVDLGVLAADAVDMYQPIAAERGIGLRLWQQRALARGDADQLFQAVVNLLDNAVKYTAAGTCVDVAVNMDAGEALLSVRDEGPGIASEDRQRVFDRFQRLELHRGSPGSGLGLSLVRAIVKRHGGSIALDDGNPGLVVRLRLPAA